MPYFVVLQLARHRDVGPSTMQWDIDIVMDKTIASANGVGTSCGKRRNSFPMM